MKTIFISGYRWSGSSAASELIYENFNYQHVPGDEFVPLNLGLLPISNVGKVNRFRKFITPFFLDPLNAYKKASSTRFLFIKLIIYIIAIKKRWLLKYKLRLSEMLSDGYPENKEYEKFVCDVYGYSKLKENTVKKIVPLVETFTNCVRQKKENLIIANNAIPALYIELLSELSKSNDNLVISVSRNAYDQGREIKKFSFTGKFNSLNHIINEVTKIKNEIQLSGNSFKDLKFEGLVLDEKYRKQFLNMVSDFLQLNKKDYTYNAVSNSAKNISSKAKEDYFNL